jgi:two-component system, NarL family, nitrate/nitrite response regulator NarL
MVTVYILGHVRLYRECFELYFAGTPSVSVVGSAPNSVGALESLRRIGPEVLLLDLGLEVSLRVASMVRAALPNIRLVVLGLSGTVPEVIACAESGATGYVTSEDTLSDLVVTIERAARGETFCPPSVTATLFERIAALASTQQFQPVKPNQRLSGREVEILSLIERGLSNKEIARTLCIATATVKNHVHNVLSKLQVRRRADATFYLARQTEAAGVASATIG